MRRRTVFVMSILALSSLFLIGSQRLSAQAPEPTDELIETADGMKLRGIFYKALNSKNGSCVLLIHEPFTDPTKGDWDGLARTLAKNGYHTLRFDFRGHGKSKELIPAIFWRDQFNTRLSGARRNPPKDTLEEKDFKDKSFYFPQLVYDIAAARNHLDKLNDDGQVNSSTVYLIGDGDATTLGMMFLATEWHREQRKPVGFLNEQKLVIAANQYILPGGSPSGRDYGGAVWLTPKIMKGFSTSAVKRWVQEMGRSRDGDMRSETPMLFVYGEKDSDGKRDANYFNENVMVSEGRGRMAKLDSTFVRERKGTALQGVSLLGKNDALGTEKMILEFIEKMEEIRRSKVRITREYSVPLKINLASFGS